MPEKIIVFTGAGISAESGLQTFRDSDGLWEKYDVMQLATPEAFAADPELVLRFYNGRKETANAAQPNAAHKALAKLKDKFDLTVITQNVDDLHERGGVDDVIHLHGQLHYARSTTHPDYIEYRPTEPIKPGDKCPDGGQLRPHIVWFGEMPMRTDEAVSHIRTCDKILVVGTSLSVYARQITNGFAVPPVNMYLKLLNAGWKNRAPRVACEGAASHIFIGSYCDSDLVTQLSFSKAAQLKISG